MILREVSGGLVDYALAHTAGVPEARSPDFEHSFVTSNCERIGSKNVVPSSGVLIGAICPSERRSLLSRRSVIY